ncbi:hypothetical protein ebA4002 [Aromatoleum aromaticum EbN1]|uniref:Uncharacterized protein n=1 Tax=Aromatoleum aromaticum (strain DSM 19018 / LMG 30748 / EbN1) TaxID=76114 RepID=Q5P2R9_AROAE|nr:hypothetical protein ebA4002 [Aromatoleum aromaticum EbN1]
MVQPLKPDRQRNVSPCGRPGATIRTAFPHRLDLRPAAPPAPSARWTLLFVG